MGRAIKTKINLDDIYFDEELYPRAGYNWQTGYDYSQSIRVGAKFPPIILALFKGKKYLVDGKHRIEAYKLLKIKKVDAVVYTGWNKNKIFVEAVKANISHGRMLSPFEKRKITLKLMEMNLKEAEISKLVQIPQDKLQNFVGQRLVNTITGEEITDEQTEQISRDIGRAILKSGIKQLAGQTFSSNELKNIESTQKEFYMSSQITLLEQFINLLENDLIDKKDKSVIVLIKKIKKLLNKY